MTVPTDATASESPSRRDVAVPPPATPVPAGTPAQRDPVGQRAAVAALTLLAILMVAGIVHIASLLLVPRVAPDDAYARLAAAVPEDVFTALPRGGSAGSPLPDRDPAVATAVCRYDLARGPLRVTAALGDAALVALTLHARDGLSFYALDDRAGNDGRLDLVVMTAGQLGEAQSRDTPDAPVRDVRVVAPEEQGFAAVDVLPRVGGYAEALRALSSAGCRVEHPL